MKTTVQSMLESESIFGINSCTNIFESLQTLTESEQKMLKYTPKKVIVHKQKGTNKYIVEYADNLDRLMEDQEIGFEEAVNYVCREFDIESDRLNIAITVEDAISLDDFENLSEEYTFVAM